MLPTIVIVGSDPEKVKVRLDQLIKNIFEPMPIRDEDVLVLSPLESGGGKKKSSEAGIDQVRQGIKWLTTSSHNPVGIKVWVIKQAHLMSLPAQNALLKTMEEPLLGRHIILTTPSSKKLPETLISRAYLVRLDHRQAPTTKGWTYLKKQAALPYPTLVTLAERLSLRGYDDIVRFISDVYMQVFDDADLSFSQKAKLSELFDWSLKALDNNVNPKNVLVNLVWQVKLRLAGGGQVHLG